VDKAKQRSKNEFRKLCTQRCKKRGMKRVRFCGESTGDQPRPDKRFNKETTLREMILFTYRVSIYRDRGTPARTGSEIQVARPGPRSSDCSSHPRDHRSNSRPRRDRGASPALTLCCPERHVHRLQKQFLAAKCIQRYIIIMTIFI